MQGTYPVIFLSFAAVKSSTYEEAREGIIQILVKSYGKYHYLRNFGIMSSQDLEYYDSVKLDMTDTTAAFLMLHLRRIRI